MYLYTVFKYNVFKYCPALITPFPHPLHSLECVTPRSNMITAAHILTSSTQIVYAITFFIFCPICMKVSHNILHTYSFILSTIKHNWKIRRFWVVDPLKIVIKNNNNKYTRKKILVNSSTVHT